MKYLIVILFAAVAFVPQSVYGQNQGEIPAVEHAEEAQAVTPNESELRFGNGEPQVEIQDEGFSVFGFWDLVRMILVLAFVIAAIYGVFYLLKRSSSRRLGGGAGLLRIVDEQALAGGKTLHLIEVGRQVFLVGAGDDSVRLISEITDDETLDTIRLAVSAEATSPSGGFADLLSSLWPSNGRTGAAAQSGGHDGGGAAATGTFDFIGRQRERLRRLR